MDLHFFSGLCSAWTITSKLWERGNFGYPVRGHKKLFGSASNSLQLGVISTVACIFMHPICLNAYMHACISRKGAVLWMHLQLPRNGSSSKWSPNSTCSRKWGTFPALSKTFSIILATYILVNPALRLFMSDQLQRDAQHILNPNCCLLACMHACAPIKIDACAFSNAYR